MLVDAVDPCGRQAASHKLNQDVGGDVLSRKDGLGAAIGVGSDKLERTAANAGDALVSCPVSFPKPRPRERLHGGLAGWLVAVGVCGLRGSRR